MLPPIRSIVILCIVFVGRVLAAEPATGVVSVIAETVVPVPPAMTTGSALVHVLAKNDTDRLSFRERLRPLLGLATIEARSDLTSLPYPDRLCRVVFVPDLPASAGRGLSIAEVLRVTATGGEIFLGGTTGSAVDEMLTQAKLKDAVSQVQQVSGGVRLVKAGSADLGEWPMAYRVDASFLRVAPDALNPPVYSPNVDARIGGFSPRQPEVDAVRDPLWPVWMDGEHRPLERPGSAGLAAAEGLVVSASYAEHPSIAEGKRKPVPAIVVRDAASGVPLWSNTSGARPLAIGGNVVLAGSDGDIQALDARTGDPVWSAETPNRNWMAVVDNRFVVGGSALKCLSLENGDEAWSAPLQSIRGGITGNRVVVQEGVAGKKPQLGDIVAYDLASGNELWRVGAQQIPGFSFEGVSESGVLIQSPREVAVLSAEDGSEKIRRPFTKSKPGWNSLRHGAVGSPDAVLYRDHLVLIEPEPAKRPAAGPPGRAIAVPLDGGPDVILDHAQLAGAGFWACTGGGTMTAGMLEAAFQKPPQKSERKDWLGTLAPKGTCGVPTVIAQGTAFSPPHGCACAGLWGAPRGLVATASAPTDVPREAFETPSEIEKGPGFALPGQVASGSDWPCFRGNVERSNSTNLSVQLPLRQRWTTKLAADRPASPIVQISWQSRFHHPAAITPPVVSDKLLVVALPEEHSVVALDPATGRERWRFVIDAAVDSPPTIAGDLVLFGGRDGFVYCLNAADGKLRYRRSVAPVDRRFVNHGMFEATFPVIGSVAVVDGLAYATAGAFGTVGVQLMVFDPLTGEVHEYRRLPFGLYSNDVLAADPDGQLHLGPVPLDPALASQLNAPKKKKTPSFADLLPRIGTGVGSANFRNHLVANDGALIDVARTRSVVTVGNMEDRMTYAMGQMLQGQAALAWAWNERQRIMLTLPPKQESNTKKGQGPSIELVSFPAGGKSSEATWSLPARHDWTFVLAGDQLIVAGSSLDGSHKLWIRDAATGEVLSESDLPAAPVQDGIAIASNGLFLSLVTGEIVAW